MPKLLASWCGAGSVGYLRLLTGCSGARKTRATLRRRLLSRLFETCEGFEVRQRSRRGCTGSRLTSASRGNGVRRVGVERLWGTSRTMARGAINSLPLELRQVVVMKEFEELTFREISDALGLPLSTVKSRLYTALKQLQMRLQKFESRA